VVVADMEASQAGRGRGLTRWATAAACALTLVAASGAAFVPAAAATGDGAHAGTSQVASTQPVSILNAPTLVAHTALGDVGYREVGTGSPIVLITGYLTSMDDWAPSFLDALAAHHRVVVFDNAGVGETSPLPGPLTISGMADQTSALIAALRLHRPAVLGWSMGGMIAQALAVRHPDQVGRLVLAATQAGNGQSLPVPAAAAAALNSPNPLVVLSVLFPADQSAAEQAYIAGVLEYPNRYSAPENVRVEQSAALDQWFAGQDPSGREVGRIRVPILIADGAQDALDPAPNAWILAHAVHGAPVLLFPDAGHAFLFQDSAQIVPILDLFDH
jgi:pimeloyl-ACP methyl ester carboxylesterase